MLNPVNFRFGKPVDLQGIDTSRAGVMTGSNNDFPWRQYMPFLVVLPGDLPMENLLFVVALYSK
jgi:hypothetical protein